MTVIAYRDGVLASDSLVSAAHTRCGSTIKIMEHEGHLFGMAGVIHGLAHFAESVIRGDEYRCGEKEFAAIHIDHVGNVFHYHGEAGTFGLCIKAPFHAIGSGADIAIGAMEMGATAEEAVKAAIKHNTTCGGKVRKIEL